jgi:hypothetical protein
MKINCFQIPPGPKLTSCEYSFAIDALRQRNARIWVDLQDADAGELEEKLNDI